MNITDLQVQLQELQAQLDEMQAYAKSNYLRQLSEFEHIVSEVQRLKMSMVADHKYFNQKYHSLATRASKLKFDTVDQHRLEL